MPVFCQHRTSPTKTFKCGPSFAALSGLSAEMFWHSVWITNREICHYDWFGQNVGGWGGGGGGLGAWYLLSPKEPGQSDSNMLESICCVSI